MMPVPGATVIDRLDNCVVPSPDTPNEPSTSMNSAVTPATSIALPLPADPVAIRLIADAVIYLIQAATALRLDFDTLVRGTAEHVMRRDWTTNKADGGAQ